MAYMEVDTFVIHNISEMLEYVKKNKLRSFHNSTNSMSWYRGQSNYEWHLEPSVYRNNNFEYESVFIKEFERIRPSEFVFNNKFEKLVKMQHYGLPTRLLDITSNPLVALYFACHHNPNKDGAFYYFSTPTFWDDNYAINRIVNYVFNPSGSVETLVTREITNLLDITKDFKELRQDILHTLCVPAHAVLPRFSNQRIIQQSGAFLLFGMKIAHREISDNPGLLGKEFITFDKLDSNSESQLCPVIEKIRIPFECKKTILEELDLLNINEGFLFPELEYQSRNIVNYIKNKILPQ